MSSTRMNTHDYRISNQYEPDLATAYRHHSEAIWNRLTQPSIILPLLGLLLYVIYGSNFGPTVAPLPVFQRLWDLLVRLVPAKLLFAIDEWLNPIPFPRPMNIARNATYEAKSEALARLLGRGRPGAIIASVSYAGKTGLSSLMPKKNLDTPAGLGNSNMSCYQNSILQGLASLKPVREYLTKIASEGDCGLPRVYVTEALAVLVADLYSPEKNGQTIWTPSILKNMSTYQQQDAQEYFAKLLDKVEKEITRAQTNPGFWSDGTGDETVASQHSDDSGYQSNLPASKVAPDRNTSFRFPLEGSLGERVACTVCNDSSGLKMSSFPSLTLTLGTELIERDLGRLLDSFTAIERIEDLLCVKCTLSAARDKIVNSLKQWKANSNPSQKKVKQEFRDRLESIETALADDDFEENTLTEVCKIPKSQRVTRTKTKQTAIARPPQSLAFHINRSIFDFHSGIHKNTARVAFPLQLDLGPWCLGSAGVQLGEETTTTPATASANHNEQWHFPSEQPMIAGSQKPSKLTGPFYELRAVVTHRGDHDSGHYICYRKHPPTKRDTQGEAPSEEQNAPVNLAAEDDVEDHDAPAANDNDSSPKATNGMINSEDSVEYDDDWWRLSDQNVTRVSESFVLGQGSQSYDSVFMLFYDRVDPNSILISGQGAAEEENVESTTTGTATARSEPVSYSLEEALQQAVSIPLPVEDDGF